MTICCWGIAICLVFIPLVKDFWLLNILVLLPGYFGGFLDAAIQAIMFQVWGPKKSRPLIQKGFHIILISTFGEKVENLIKEFSFYVRHRMHISGCYYRPVP